VDVGSSFDATDGAVIFTGAGNLHLSGIISSLGTFICGTGTVLLQEVPGAVVLSAAIH
jgi:hypothetical protein